MKPAVIAASAGLLLAAGVACAQQKPQIISERPQGAAKGSLTVTSTSFQAGGPIARKYSGYGQNVSPQVAWTAVRPAKSYALVVEDPDGHGPTPVVHWLAWNIPAGVTSLPEGLGQPPAGMAQGTNSHKHAAYDGPHPPPGDPPHHYHVQVFALDRTLTLPPGAEREAFVGQVAGHILARGDLVGTYAEPKPGG